MPINTSVVSGVVGRADKEAFDKVIDDCAAWAKQNCFGSNVIIKIDVVPLWLGYVEEQREKGNVAPPETNKANDDLARKLGLGGNDQLIDDPRTTPPEPE